MRKLGHPGPEQVARPASTENGPHLRQGCCKAYWPAPREGDESEEENSSVDPGEWDESQGENSWVDIVVWDESEKDDWAVIARWLSVNDAWRAGSSADGS